MSRNKNVEDERGWDPAGTYGRSLIRSRRCYMGHPPLTMPGTDLRVFGGSCSNPAVTEADVYVGLCLSMKASARAWPWKVGTEFLFAITDMCAPNNPTEFMKLMAWLKKQVDAGSKVHIGCIGGHGRTGMVLSALVSLYGEKGAISYVRENYCTKAVESREQVEFLHKHFGIAKVSGAKEYARTPKTSGQRRLTADPIQVKTPDKDITVRPIAGARSIWG